MTGKYLFAAAVFSMLLMPGLASAQSTPETEASTERDAQSLLSAFMAYTDLRIASIQRSLEILAATAEARSGQWQKMKGLLGAYQESESGLVVWHVRPDGSYCTVDKGLMDQKLSDRRYFPDLMAGRKITGALVVSKSTGQRSAVIAVPIGASGKPAGAIGASLFLDKLSGEVASALALRNNVSFFAIAPNGLTTLNTRQDRHFLDPREQGSETLEKAANEMLSRTAGETDYEFDNANKHMIYRKSPLTQWRFALVTATPLAEPASRNQRTPESREPDRQP